MRLPFAKRPGPRSDRRFRHVHLIDTTVASDNIGDEIIMDAIRPYLEPMLEGAYVTSSAGHDGLGPFGRPHVENADIVFLLGTNALAPFDQMARRRFIWMVRPEDVDAYAGKVVLFGVGANCYFDSIDRAQRRLLRKVLSRRHLHSVRDGVALDILKAVGVEGVNTSCPTLWRFAGGEAQGAAEKAPAVCFTLTSHKAGEADKDMVRILREGYERVLFWPQQPRDLDYLHSLTVPGAIEIVPPNLRSYDELLAAGGVDVIGTRLHGCIRGLHHGCRVLVISIDNRAAEIGRETGLPILMRDEIGARLGPLIDTPLAARLTLPGEAIGRFLNQFQTGLATSTT